MKIVNKSKRKPNTLCVVQGKEFHNSFMLKWLDDNGILIYSTHNEGQLKVAERFLTTFKSKVYNK